MFQRNRKPLDFRKPDYIVRSSMRQFPFFPADIREARVKELEAKLKKLQAKLFEDE